MQRPSYPRTPLERQGNVNWRVPDNAAYEINHRKSSIQITSDKQPNCSIFVSKRKGFGTTGNKESTPMSTHGIDLLARSFPKDKFMRYKVNIYLKE